MEKAPSTIVSPPSVTTEVAVLPNEAIIRKLAETYEESEQKEIARNMFLVTQFKKKTIKAEDGKTNIKVPFTPFEALGYIMICKELGFNPMLNNIIMLEDQFYITLTGHLQNAHGSKALVWMDITEESAGKVQWEITKWEPNPNWNWKNISKTITKEFNQYKYKCTISKKIGDTIAIFTAEWLADMTNVTWWEKSSDLKIRQMAEARAMRRCLSRAFAVWMANYEDVYEEKEREVIYLDQPSVSESQVDPNQTLIDSIKSAEDIETLENLKIQISASKNQNIIKLYSKKMVELQDVDKKLDEVKKLDNEQLEKFASTLTEPNGIIQSLKKK